MSRIDKYTSVTMHDKEPYLSIRSEMAWIDMETTGLLDKGEDQVPLEIGAVITDKDGYKVASFVSLILPSNWTYFMQKADRYVQNMHAKNGLASDLVEADQEDYDVRGELSFNSVDNRLRAFLETYGGDPKQFPMAGSTINFDREFMRFLPRSLDWFHYRNQDVTSLRNFCKPLNPAVYSRIPEIPEDRKQHRPLADIDDSIGLYQFFKDNFLFTA
jgi:oligoribonuclease